MALSGCCSHEAIRVNLIPRPAEMEVLSGYFQPGNTTVDDFTTVVVDNSRMDALGREGYELTVDRSRPPPRPAFSMGNGRWNS